MTKSPFDVSSPIHLVGIGGSGMSGIARIFLARGFAVSGSDSRESQEVHALRALGARIAVGHRVENLEPFDRPVGVVITSTAIPETNEEIIAARERAVPVLHRSEALAWLLLGRKSIAIAGTHGKTTTTSMLTVALQSLGLDPSYAIGAGLGAAGSNAHHGNGEYFVLEADESDKSFLAYHPQGAIITNLEADHLDQFNSLEEIEVAFQDFARSVSGPLVICGDDAGNRKLIQNLDREVMTYGFDSGNDLTLAAFHPLGRGSIADVTIRGKKMGQLRLNVPGIHNVLNAGGVIAMADRQGLPIPEIRDGLATFRGARRRFDVRGEVNGVSVIDDYAHHPTEIVATLRAARQVAPRGRLIAIFQPHRFTRLQAFMNEFASSLALADSVAVMDVYGAGENSIPGCSGKRLAELIPGGQFIPSFLDVSEWAVSQSAPGDLIFTMGAGDVTLLPNIILDQLGITIPDA